MVVVIGQADVSARPRHPEKARLPDTPVLPKPPWIRVKAPGAHDFDATREILRAHRLVTVCEEAACPNIGECWEQAPRHLHDHGRHLHARLRLLQCSHREARRAR